jgi:hypothetical protein
MASKPAPGIGEFEQALELHQRGDLAQAKVLYLRVLRAQPGHLGAIQYLGVAASQEKDYGRAIELLSRAIAFAPDQAGAYSNRGLARHESGHHEAAIADFNKTLSIDPGFFDAHYNLGNTLRALGRLDAAVASYDRAIALRPDAVNAHLNRSFALMLKGDLAKGWEAYEWRWETARSAPFKRNFPQPMWRGDTSLAGRRILLHSEQGLGDTIQFCRYVERVAALGAQVILEVHPSLVDLLAGLPGVSEMVVSGSPLPAFDGHCPLMSLPLAFKTELHTIPGASRYLSASPAKLAHWARALGPKTKARVGLVWSGNAGHANDAHRSLTLSTLLRHVSAEVQFVSLQRELRDVDKPALAAHAGAVIHYGEALRDFSDTAALCELMDLVICVDTSVAHLSAALGRPTWLLLAQVPDWRWMLERDDSPWYPSATLYRQAVQGDWSDVLARVDVHLMQRLGRSAA